MSKVYLCKRVLLQIPTNVIVTECSSMAFKTAKHSSCVKVYRHEMHNSCNIPEDISGDYPKQFHVSPSTNS